MTAEETIASLEAQLKQALEQLGQVTEQLQQTQEQLQAAQARIAELEKRKHACASIRQSEEEKTARGAEEAAQEA